MKYCGGRRKSKWDSGMTMLELVAGMAVLAVGMTAVTALFHMAILNDNRAKVDTSATTMAQMVLEKIAAQPANQMANIGIADCAPTPTTWQIATVAAASPGNGADVNPANGAIDFTQPYANVPANYKMQFAGCGTQGRQIIWDVRWNLRTISANTRLITVAAHPLPAANNPVQFVQPITLRTIGGL